jgi:hypothetical protein
MALARGPSAAEKAQREALRRAYFVEGQRDENARLRNLKKFRPSYQQPRLTFEALRAAVLMRDRKAVLACLTPAAQAEAAGLTSTGGGPWPDAADLETFYTLMGTRFYGQQSTGDKAQVWLETKVRDPADTARPPTLFARRRSVLSMERVSGHWLITDAKALPAIGKAPTPATPGAPAPVSPGGPQPAGKSNGSAR